jgi:glycosyltransferase involved in cell wall biosynthesis
MKQKKKIFHFHPNGELARHFVSPLIEAELKAGHNSKLITSTKSVAVNAILIPFDLNLKNLFSLIPTFFRVYWLLLSERPDVLVSHNSKSSSIVLISAWLAKIPKRVYFNHGVPYCAYQGIVRFVLKLLERLNLFYSTHVITVSKDMQNLLLKLDGKKAIQIIHEGSACGLDLSRYGPNKNKNSTFRFEHNITSNDFLIVFIGRPEKRKGFNLVLEMWEKYFLTKDLKLVLCGPSEFDVVKCLGFLPDNVICLGFTNRVPEILSQSDLLLLTSFHEGLSYAALESMASGCIVVANNIPGIRNLVTSGTNGFLVDNNNIKKYAEIIHGIKSNPKFYKDLTQISALQVAEKFSRKYFIPKYLTFIN